MGIAISLLILGGLYHEYKIFLMIGGESRESMPHKSHAYLSAFIIGAVVYGGAANVVYWIAHWMFA